MLTGKNIVMGVTGGIAAWKACLILNKLVIDLHANVDVIMTKNAETFITEQTIRTLSRNIVTRDMFKEPAVAQRRRGHQRQVRTIEPCCAATPARAR